MRRALYYYEMVKLTGKAPAVPDRRGKMSISGGAVLSRRARVL
jgi:hypothetical protein